MKLKIIYTVVLSYSVFATVSSCAPDAQKKNAKSTQNDKTGITDQSIHFGHISQVYNDTNSTKWTDKGSFWWLYFEPGKVFFDFNPSCGYWFPSQLKKDKIIFFWEKNADCTFNRGLDTAFKNVKSPEKGKPFGEILLVNDTTISISYYYSEWIKKVNEAERETIDTLFPSIFYIMRL